MKDLLDLHTTIKAQRADLVKRLHVRFPKGCIVRVRFSPNPLEYVVEGYCAPESVGFGSLIGFNPATGRRRTFHFTRIMGRRFPRGGMPVAAERLEASPCE